MFQNKTINTTAQELLLANKFNKSRFITKLMETLNKNNILCYQDKGDADRLIVQTVVDLSINSDSRKVVIVSEDIDVMVLLTALTPPDGKAIFYLKPNKNKAPALIFFLQKVLKKIIRIQRNCNSFSTFFYGIRYNFMLL